MSFLHHYTLRSRLPERARGRGAALSSASLVLRGTTDDEHSHAGHSHLRRATAGAISGLWFPSLIQSIRPAAADLSNYHHQLQRRKRLIHLPGRVLVDWLIRSCAVDNRLGDVAEFAVAVLRQSGQVLEGVIGAVAVAGHQDAFGLLDDRAGLHCCPHLIRKFGGVAEEGRIGNCHTGITGEGLGEADDLLGQRLRCGSVKVECTDHSLRYGSTVMRGATGTAALLNRPGLMSALPRQEQHRNRSYPQHARHTPPYRRTTALATAQRPSRSHRSRIRRSP
jgi:hypothetical protein